MALREVASSTGFTSPKAPPPRRRHGIWVCPLLAGDWTSITTRRSYHFALHQVQLGIDLVNPARPEFMCAAHIRSS